MPIPQRFSFLGDSGNWGLSFFNSSGIGEYKTGEFLRNDIPLNEPSFINKHKPK